MAAITLVFTLSGTAYALKCNVCHSKNPRMVRMHEALEFRGCSSCHQPGILKPPPGRESQMRNDPLCSRCHGGVPDTSGE